MEFVSEYCRTGVARPNARPALPLPQDLLHLLSLGEFIHELVEVPGLPRQRGLDLFNPVAADDAGDQVRVGVEGCLGEELFEGELFVLDVLLQRPGIEARQPPG